MISFLLVPIYTHALSTAEYGLVDLITTVGTIVMSVLSINVGEAIMRFGLDRDTDHRKVMRTGLVILCAVSVAGLVLIPVCRQFSGLAAYGELIYAYVVTLACSQVFLSYLRGQEKLMAYSVGNILHTAVAAGLNILFLVVFRWEIRGYLLAYVGANVISAVYAGAVGRVDRAVCGVQMDRELSLQMLRYSVVLIPNTFMWWIINSSDRVMVTAIAGAAENGIYAIAYKVPSLLHTIAAVFAVAWSYSAIRESGSSDEQEYHNQTYHRMVQTLICLVAAMLLVIKPFIRCYVAEEFASAWMYTPPLFIGFLFQALGQFLATSYTVHKNSLGFLASSMLGAGVNILLNLLLIPRFWVMGAAVATCISYFAVFLFRGIHTRKYMDIRLCRPQYLVGCGLLAAMSGALYLDGPVSGVVMVCLCGGGAYVFREYLLTVWLAIRRRGKGNEHTGTV